MHAIWPVILSGGAGTRLWPMSRVFHSKPLLPLIGDTSLLQETARRVAATDRFQPPVVVSNQEHRFLVAEQLQEIGVKPHSIILEPQGRNTAPAAAVAALMLAQVEPDSLILVLPSDHVIQDEAAFHAAIDQAAQAAMMGYLMTFGVEPRGPETGYGYIRRSKDIAGAPGCYRVECFTEKPDRETAEKFLKEGSCYWNSGIFLFSARLYLDELARLQPRMLEACRQAVTEGSAERDFFWLERSRFAASPSASIDCAVMERTSVAGIVPVEMGWSDLGSWSALWDIQTKDPDGNAIVGDVVLHNVGNSYLRSEGPLVVAVGIDDAVVVAMEDVVLVAGKDRAQEVKLVAEKLATDGRGESKTHRQVHRPWGTYKTIDSGERFLVKRITVLPGQKLSLQQHYHRAEHLLVVKGTAQVTLGEEDILLRENESFFVPTGVKHRFENPGEVPLELIEIQYGDSIDEDDIQRFEDIYGRAD